VKLSRFALIVLYMAYLINVGLLLILLPWSSTWGRLLTSLPIHLAWVLDQPWVRGLIAAFGGLHLLLVTWELVNPTLLIPSPPSKPESRESSVS
jgi:hypothetical protein